MISLIKKIYFKYFREKRFRKKSKHYFIKDDVIDYYNSIESSSSYQNAVRNLLLELDKREIKTDSLDRSILSTIVIAGSKLNNEDKVISKGLLKHCVKKLRLKLEPWELIHLYMLVLRLGLFSVGLELRKSAVEKYLQKSTFSSKLDIQLLLSAKMESSPRLINSQIFTTNIKTLGKNNIFLKYQAICKPGHIDNTGISNSRKDFRGLIEKKNVVIVGPAETNNCDASTIDSADVVIRMNYKKNGVGTDSKFKGLKCDVTYFSNAQVLDFVKMNNCDWPSCIDWVVVSDKKYLQLMNDKLNSLPVFKSGKLRKPNLRLRLNNVNELAFNTNYTALPKIILDILQFNPRTIKIYHSDLMLTINRVKGYVPKSWEWENNMKKTFLDICSRLHDPATQYIILQNFWKLGIIDGDQGFSNVMNMGLEGYMQNLEKIYGNAGRISSLFEEHS